MLEHDNIVTYQDPKFPGGGRGAVRVRTYRHANHVVALMTELFNNPGPSITNAAEAVTGAVQREFGFDVVCVEHYPREGGSHETLAVVKIDGRGNPGWYALSDDDLVTLIGETPTPHTAADEPAWLQLAAERMPADPRVTATKAAAEIAAQAELNRWLAGFTELNIARYIGTYDPMGTPRIVVIADGQASLLPHYVRHSPLGFNWGYAGSGPAESARCLLAHALRKHPNKQGDMPTIDGVYMAFKFEVIAKIRREGFDMTPRYVRSWYKAHNKALTTRR